MGPVARRDESREGGSAVSSHFFDRRRSEHFAELLEDPDRLRRHRRLRRVESEMDWGVRTLRRVEGLARQLPPQSAAPDEFRHAFRSMLVAAAKRQSACPTDPAAAASDKTVDRGTPTALVDRKGPTYHRGQPHRTPSLLRSPAPRARAAVLVGVTAGALALSGVSAASTDSLPGDPLYQVKRSSERAQLALAASDQARAQLYLEFARSRVLEARQIPAGLAESTLADMDADTVDGVRLLTAIALQRNDPGVLAPVAAFVADQRKRLAELQKTLAATGAESLRQSVSLLNDVDERVRTLSRAIVRGCDILPTMDHLGARPTSC